MKVMQSNAWQNARHWQALVGVLAMAWAITNATGAAAQPREDHGPKEHGRPALAGPHGEHGPARGERPDMMRGGPEREHEHQGASDAGVMHGPHEAIRRRIDELEKKGDKLTPQEKQELEGLRANKHRMPWGQRKARFEQLKARLDAGKLTESEQAELEKMRQLDVKHQALEANDKVNAESRKQRAREAKRQALRESVKVGKDADTTAEYRKYAERMAKLERAQALATADDDKELIQKIQALIGKEQQRHGEWLTKHTSSPQGAAQ